MVNLQGLTRPAYNSLIRMRRVAQQVGLRYQITSAHRSSSHQAKLYKRYLAGLSALPAAPPGRSAHERGTAVDVVFSDTDTGVYLMQRLGWQWAGPSDYVHFEWRGKASRRRQPATRRANVSRKRSEGQEAPSQQQSTLSKLYHFGMEWILGGVARPAPTIRFQR